MKTGTIFGSIISCAKKKNADEFFISLFPLLALNNENKVLSIQTIHFWFYCIYLIDKNAIHLTNILEDLLFIIITQLF